MSKLNKEFETALKVCELISTNDNVDDFITALNKSPSEVKAWFTKVLPHGETFEEHVVKQLKNDRDE